MRDGVLEEGGDVEMEKSRKLQKIRSSRMNKLS